MSRIELIGLSSPNLTGGQWALLRRCQAVVTSRRHRSLVEELGKPLIDITPLSTMLDAVETKLSQGDVAILASGDPLFYGIGRALIARFGPERITVHPALSAIQLACARFHLPWDDLDVLSLHGRAPDGIPGRILQHERVLLFTDHRNSPDAVARYLLAALRECEDLERLAAIRVRVAENLGLAEERLVRGSLAEIAGAAFASLNLMLVEQPPLPARAGFGLTEGEIRHSRGLITKDEVRAATLHRLRLPERGVFWDIGGGSGSVSLEAAGLRPDLSIYTIEKKPEEQANIRANIRQFGAYTIQLIPGEAPEALDGLPDPSRIFIGGSGRRLPEIIERATARLLPGGRIVLNAVLPETETTALSCLQRLGLTVASSTLVVSRWDGPEGERREFNPITLITGDKDL